VALSPGTTFDRYRIIEPLGRGGMATVYRAYEPKLDRYVALKVLPGEFLHDETFPERFRREAQNLARLEHPNIVPIYAYDIENGIPWMAMRLIAGGALSGLLRAGPLPPGRVVAILRGAASALDHAHANGVMHRDIKPQNILLDESGHVYLADFGIARMVEGGPKLTQTGMISGTPQYMAPEQATGLKVDHFCDIYAIGIVAYEMLTGRVPFAADTPVAVLMKHVQDPIPLPSTREVPEPLVRALLKCLAKKPQDRWPSAGAFVEALDRGLAAQPALAAAAPTLDLRPTEPAAKDTDRLRAIAVPTTVRPRPRPERPRASSRAVGAVLALAAVIVLVIGAGGALFLWRSIAGGPDPRPAPGVAADVAPEEGEPAGGTDTAAGTSAAPADIATRPAVGASRPPARERPAPAPGSETTTASSQPMATQARPRAEAAPPRAEAVPPRPEPPAPSVEAPSGPPAHVRALIDSLDGGNTEAAWRAAESLGNLGGEARPAVPALIAALGHRSEVVRWRSAEALGRIGPGAKAAVPALTEALSDRDALVRTEAAKALGQLGPAASGAVPALAESLRQSDVYFRREVARALARIGPETGPAVPALTDALRDKDKFVRMEAAKALGRAGALARSAVPALNAALKDSEMLVAREAAEALKRISGAPVGASF
jgi:serine/threonine-protein kinase